MTAIRQVKPLTRLARTIQLIGAFLALISLAGPAHALKMSPFVSTFAPKGSGANQIYRIENDSPEPAAVQVSMARREMDENGREHLIDAEDEFAVFPPQIVLAPGEAKTVRVQWIGDPAPKAELSYRIVVEQLPVELGAPRKGGQVRLLVRYEGSVYVAPGGVQSALSVVECNPTQAADGSPRLEVAVRNAGTAHAILANAKLTLRLEDGRTVVLAGDKLKGLDGENVLAGKLRRFAVPWPDGLGRVKLAASIDYTPSP